MKNKKQMARISYSPDVDVLMWETPGEKIDYAKEDLQVGFNYQYLLDFLTTADETQISFEFKDSESAAQLRSIPSSDYNYRYVVMPMRI